MSTTSASRLEACSANPWTCLLRRFRPGTCSVRAMRKKRNPSAVSSVASSSRPRKTSPRPSTRPGRWVDAVHLSEPHGLIDAFATSAAFLHEPSALLFRLKGTTAALPASVCSLAERAVDVWGTGATDITTSLAGDAAVLSELIVRYYAQEGDEERISRALDAIDRMIERSFLGIDDRLDAVDRA